MGPTDLAARAEERSRRSGLARTLARTAATLTLLLLIVDGDFMLGPPITHWIPLVVFTFTGLIGWLAVARDPARLDVELVVAAVVPVAAAVITATVSAFPSLSWSAAWHLAILSGTGLLIWYTIARWGRQDALVVLGTIVVLLVVVYLVQVLLAYGAWLGLGMSVTTIPLRPLNAGGLALIPTWLSDYVVLAAPIMVVVFARAGRGGRWAAALLAVASVAVVIIGGTRSIWLVAGVVAVGLLAAALWRRGRGRVVIGLGLGAVLVGSVVFALTIGGRVARSLDEGRLSAFASALAEFARAPLTGGGPGTYGEYRLGYPVQILYDLVFPNSHDVVLSTLAEEGVIGLVALGALVACCLIVLRRRWRDSGSDLALLIAAAAGIVMVLGHALVDVVIDVPGIMVCLLIVAGIALVRPVGVEAGDGEYVTTKAGVGWTKRRGRRAALGAVVVGIALLAVTGSLAFRPELSLVRQVQADDSLPADPGAALTAALDAASLTPDSTPAWNAVAVAADLTGHLDGAITAVRRMIALEPLAQHKVELAILLDRTGDAGGAIREMRLAAEDQRDPFVQLNASVLLASHGLTAEASRAATQLIVLQPLIGLQRGALPADMQTLWGSATAVAVGQLEAADRWDDALAAALSGDAQLAPRVVVASPAARRSLLTTIEAAWDGSATARASIQRAAQANPSDTSLLEWPWLLAALQCDSQVADTWGSVHAIEVGGLPQAPVDLTGDPGRTQSMWPARYPPAIWGYSLPTSPYVIGTWTYGMGSPGCGT